MKLVNKNVISRLSNKDLSVHSIFELVGRQPHHFSDYLRLRKQKQVGLMSILESLGNVYDMEKNPKLRDISSLSFTWDIETAQIPTVRFTRSNTSTGEGAAQFYIYLESNYFAKYDVLALENTQQLYVLTQAERVNAKEYRYLVQIMGGVPSAVINTAFTAANRTTRFLYTAHPEFAETGSTKQFYNVERHINYLTKIRVDQNYSGDFRAMQDLFFVENDNDAERLMQPNAKGGPIKIFKASSVEQMVIDHFNVTAGNALLFGRSTIDESTGRSVIQLENGEDIVSGDGLIAQIERYAYTISFSKKLSVRMFQNAIEYIADKRGMSMGNHITVICNRAFSRYKASALESAISLFAPQNNGTWFFTKDPLEVTGSKDPVTPSRVQKTKMPNEVAVGATFNTYIYEGNTVTFIIDEALTNHYKDKAYAIFMDTGAYETESGQVPGINLVTLKGRSMIKNYVNGIGGVDGVSSGPVSTALDASKFIVTGWRGVRVHNPYAGVIFKEQ